VVERKEDCGERRKEMWGTLVLGNGDVEGWCRRRGQHPRSRRNLRRWLEMLGGNSRVERRMGPRGALPAEGSEIVGEGCCYAVAARPGGAVRICRVGFVSKEAIVWGKKKWGGYSSCGVDLPFSFTTDSLPVWGGPEGCSSVSNSASPLGPPPR